MRTKLERPAPPSDDPRWSHVNAVMHRYGYEKDSLIEVLHSIQEEFGYLDAPALRYTAAALDMPPSQVYGVATFYHFFSLQPPAHHTCVVCDGSACHIKGTASILQAVQAETGLEPGDVSEDGQVSLQTARCIGFCGPAPVGLFDDETVGELNAASVLEQIRRWRNHEAA